MKSKSILLLLSIAFSLSAMEEVQENPKEESDQKQAQVKEKEELKVTYRMRNKDNIKLAQSLKDFFMQIFTKQLDDDIPKIDIRERKSNKKSTFMVWVPRQELTKLIAFFQTIERRSRKAQHITKNLSLLKKIKNDYDKKAKDKTELTHKDTERIEKWPQPLKELALRISKFPKPSPESSPESSPKGTRNYYGAGLWGK